MAASRSARAARGRDARDGVRRGRNLGGIQENILVVPERIERPRLIFLGIVVALIAFGLLMIYSASSIKALNEDGTAGSYVIRQLVFVAIGCLAAAVVVVAGFDRLSRSPFIYVMWAVMVLLLLATIVMGSAGGGATRWIVVAGYRFQPSEFAKPAIVLIAAALFEELTDGPSPDDPVVRRNFAVKASFGVIVPTLLIFAQPDKGSTMILAVTLAVMMYLSGYFTGKKVLLISVAGILVFLAYSMRDAYSRARIFTMWDPWSDQFGDGYQLTQGFLAFGLGGIKGVGIGMSMQKYAYLPEAHNDFIFAIVGEETGLIGTLGVVASFVGLLWAGFGIASSAPNARGRLVAAGSTTLLVAQFLVNVCGVLGIIPLSGKPIPFLSYGGTAAVAFLIDVGLVLSVSLSSSLPKTEHDTRRAAMRVSSGDDEEEAFGGLGDVAPLPRPLPRATPIAQAGRARAQGSMADSGALPSPESVGSIEGPRRFRLVRGGDDAARSSGPDGVRLSGTEGARLTRRDGRDRIELGRTSYDRLRSSRSR